MASLGCGSAKVDAHARLRTGWVCGSCLVATLNRPEANLTGISFLIGALMAKKLELLHELLPKATLIGVLANSNFPGSNEQLSDAQAAAEVLGKKSCWWSMPVASA